MRTDGRDGEGTRWPLKMADREGGGRGRRLPSPISKRETRPGGLVWGREGWAEILSKCLLKPKICLSPGRSIAPRQGRKGDSLRKHWLKNNLSPGWPGLLT